LVRLHNDLDEQSDKPLYIMNTNRRKRYKKLAR